VCHLTTVHHPLDPRIFYKEALGLARAGYQVTVVGPGSPETAGPRAGVEIRVVPPPRSVWGRVCNLWRVLRAAWRTGAAFYHFHDPELLPAGLLLGLAGKRVVYDVHEHFPQVAMVRPWVPDWLRPALSLLVDLAERGASRCLSGVVGVVEEQGRRFCHAPFVALKNYPRLEWFPAAGKPSGLELIHVGSLSVERGGVFLLEIMRRLRETHPHIRLLAVGRFHSGQVERAFGEKLDQYDLRTQVVCWTQPVPYTRLGELIRSSRIGLIPGQVSVQNLSPFVPTKLFEYLACGLPVVASALPSIQAFYTAADWGLLADPADPADHARAIGRLLDHPEEAAAKGRRGREAVEAQFNWAQEERKMLDFYTRLEGRRR
jgi:glycosyltransferase involved in cell wall biosynthesis